MKVQCDVCEDAEAIVMCCADEAALCAECDRRIHTANKLASKHQRLSLLNPISSEERTCCDICQDKAGFFFCLEDRALLCRSCDFSIHSSNALTAKHKRFLVPGIRVSLEASLYTNERAESVQGCSLPQLHSSLTKPSALSSPGIAPPKITHTSSNSGLAGSSDSYGMAPSSSHTSQQFLPLNARSHISHQQTDKFGTISPSTMQSKELHQALPVAASGRQEVMVAPSNLASVPMNPFNHQVQLNSSWEMHPNIVGVHADNMNVGSVFASQIGGDHFAKRTSISEYLTETIPEWRMDELLSFTDASTRNFVDGGSSKLEAWKYGDIDWQANSNASEELIVAQGSAEVPSMPSAPAFSGVLRSTRGWGPGKFMKPLDLDYLLCYEDASVVPDVGDVTCLTTHFPASSPLSKRRRCEGISETMF